jgi:hypothetical protein
VSKRSIIVLVGCGVLTLATVLWVVTRPETREAVTAAPIATAPAPGTNHAPTDLAAEETHERRESADASIAAPAAVQPADAPVTATVSVHVVAKETGAPLATARVSIWPKTPRPDFSSKNVDRATGNMHESLRPDATGTVTFLDVEPNLELRVSVAGDWDVAGMTDADVPALRAGEHKEVRVELPTQNDLDFFGHIVTRAGHAPVSNAHVRVIRATSSYMSVGEEPSHEVWKREVLTETASDNDGYVVVRIAKWKLPHLTIEAEGFGLAIVIPKKGCETHETAKLIELDAAAKLSLRIAQLNGSPVAGAHVVLSTPGYSFDRHNDETIGDWSYISLPEVRWELDSLADGICVFAQLPPDIPMSARVLKDSKEVHHEAEPLVFKPGEVRELEWRLGGGCTLNGLVVDQRNEPVASQALWLEKAIPGFMPYFKAYDDSKGVIAKCTTDVAGHFVLKDVAPGEWLIGPAAVNNDLKTIASVGTPITVVAEPSQDLVLHVDRGLFIRGKLVGPNGEPVSECNVVSEGPEPYGFGEQANADKNGGFVIGPLAHGTVTLQVNFCKSFAPPELVKVEAGAQDVIIRLRQGGTLCGRVVSSQTGLPTAGEIHVTPDHTRAGTYGSGFTTGVMEDGTFALKGLDSGVYGLSVRTSDGQFGVLAGVVATANVETNGLVIPVSPGGKLKLKYDGKREFALVQITSQGATIGWNEPVKASAVEVRDAPEGALVLRVTFANRATQTTVAVDLMAGEEKEVVIHDD